MVMCYDGAMVMPENYVVISNDEMEYVEGGERLGTISAANCNRIAAMAAVGTGIATVSGAIATFIGTVLGTPLTGAILALISVCIVGMGAAASGYFWLASAYNGMNVDTIFGQVVMTINF